MKILVTGNAGSGKSTLGKRISEQLKIPLYGLDKVVWKENWIKTPKEEREKEIERITSKDNWVIEGVSKQALLKADKVIFLDIPPHKCVKNILNRFVGNGFGTRQELPDNCPEYVGVYKAVKLALVFNKVTRPWLMEKSMNENFVRVKNYKELENILVNFKIEEE